MPTATISALTPSPGDGASRYSRPLAIARTTATTIIVITSGSNPDGSGAIDSPTADTWLNVLALPARDAGIETPR